MANMGKKYREKLKLVDRSKFYAPEEAVQLLPQTAWAKFDESVDLAIKLGVDPKKAAVRGTVSLPAGSGKKVRVAVIAKEAKVEEAKNAGADVFGGDDLVDKIKGGFLDFDVVIATPDVMGAVGKLGKILGTKGLMPNPKSGTVTMEVGKVVKEFKAGKVEFKMDKTSALHMVLGKASFTSADILSNFYSALSAIQKQKPSGIKGAFIKSITLSLSMGPGIKVDPLTTLEKMEKKEE